MTANDASARARQHGENVYLALKAAFRQLVKTVGGQEAAASLTRIRTHPTIGRYGRPQESEHAPIDVVADLEKDAGEPTVTRALADAAGYLLVAKPDTAHPDNWLGRLGTLAKEAGDAIARLGEAFQSEGAITAAEVERLDLRREVREAMEALAAIDQDLRRIERAASKK